MERNWCEVEITVDTVNWKGEHIQLNAVRALKNPSTGEVLIHPYDIAKAEIKQVADCFGLEPRDISALLLIQAKAGPFKEGEVLYKYHLQKMLFYLWKTLDKVGYGESLPIDRFIAAKNGPKPAHLDEDLQRLANKKLIKIRLEKWDAATESKRIILTNEGAKLAEEIWNVLPDPYKQTAIKVKERIHPLTPDSVRNLVHKEYPEYKNTYTENDIE